MTRCLGHVSPIDPWSDDEWVCMVADAEYAAWKDEQAHGDDGEGGEKEDGDA